MENNQEENELEDPILKEFLLDDFNDKVDLSSNNVDIWKKYLTNINRRLLGATRIVNYSHSVAFTNIRKKRKNALSIIVKYAPVLAALAISSSKLSLVVNQTLEKEMIVEYLEESLTNKERKINYLYQAITALWILNQSLDELIENIIYVIDVRKDISAKEMSNMLTSFKNYFRSLPSFEQDYPKFEYSLNTFATI